MEYKEILESARNCIGPYCKACPVCNGKACGNQVPGPGAKAPGNGFTRNYDAWQKICVNMDTICPNEPVDTAVELFGTMYRYPFFAAPLGAMKMHYGDKYNDREYNSILVNACADPYSPKTVRASMGAVFRTQPVKADWAEAKAACGVAGIPVAVTALSQRAKDLRNADLRGMAVVIGSEGQGVRREILESADGELIIPMNKRCESLNAAVAAAIVMWQMKQ